MKMRQLQIHNYRSIADGTINFGDYSLLIGPNNSGKSNVLDALRTVYEKDLKFDYDRDFPKFATDDQESWVEIEYELSPEEAATIKKEYLINGNRFRVRKWLYPVERAKQGLIGYENNTLSENKFYGFQGVGQGKLGHVIYIPAVSRLEEHTKLTGPSALRELLNDILKPVLDSSEAYKELKSHVQKFSQNIRTEATPDNRSLLDLENRINEELKDWGVVFNIDVIPPQVDDIIKNLVRHTLADSTLNAEMSADAFGHGLQRRVIFTLIRLAADYTAPKEPPPKKEFSPVMELLLFEEPEAYLHPPQQDVLDTSLRQFACQPGRQVIAVSHSPQFVSYNTDDLTDLVRLCRVAGKTEVAQLDKEGLRQIFEDNQKLKDALGVCESSESSEYETEVEAARHFLWLNPDRSGLFFADAVLIVEGLSEQVLINWLIKTGQIDTGSKGVFILNAQGKYNIHRFMNLLGRLKISHVVLHDADTNKTGCKKAEHAALNELIEKSKNDYTKDVVVLPTNLEGSLEIKAGNDRWKKAALVLLAAQKGQIAEQKLNTFKEQVARLMKVLASK